MKATEKASGVGLRGPEAGDELFRQGNALFIKRNRKKGDQRNKGGWKSQGMYGVVQCPTRMMMMD